MTETPPAYGDMPQFDFDSQFLRIFESAECATQAELAKFFEVRQSSVSDAIRRRSLPAEWLITLFDKKQINPVWVLSGMGAKHLKPSL